MTSWPFSPLPKTHIPPHFRPEALARIPISYYSKLISKEPTIPWIIVSLRDRKLLCRAVPGVNDTVEYVEASSNLWIPEEEENPACDQNICKLSGLLRKPKLAESVEVEGDHLDNFLVFMRAALVHKPICEGLCFRLKDASGEERIFKVKRIRKDGDGNVLKGEFVLIAPQTAILPVSKMKQDREQSKLSFTCPPGLEGPFSQISDLIDPKILNEMRKIGVNLPRGVLMSGPPGVGKTFLVSQLAQNFGIPLKIVNGPELISSVPGESERNLSKTFEEARNLAKSNSKQKCSIIFFDEIDAIARKREGSDNLESLSEIRLLTQLLILMDGYDRSNNLDDEHVMVFAATNRPNSLDPAMRRPGRFDREIIFEPPDATTRGIILKHLLKEFDCDQVDLDEIARNCIGYVSADLASLAQEVLMFASETDGNICLKEHFVKAMKIVGPSLHRQYQVSLDNRVTWNDIAGIDEIRNELRRYIEWPLLHADAYSRMGLVAPRGVLLYGPPGCSKTTIAKAIANESGFTFYSLNGATLYSCYVGESEQQIRDIFQCARMTCPSVIFFDEIDAIVGKRSSEFGVSGSGDSVQERVLSTLLNEMDGIGISGSKRNVLVIGATNRKDLIDEALLRPGRFDRHIFIPPPSETGRIDILNLFLKGKDVDSSVDLEELAKLTEGFTGADLKGLVQEAGILAMYDETFIFKMEHFKKVLVSGGRRR